MPTEPESRTTGERSDTDYEALECFVIENDDLLELERHIGRFNIFDALRISRTEIRHSNFLAWLLDPGESHGCGDLFLNAVLIDLLRQVPREQRPVSPIALDGVQLSGIEIRREWRSIDLLIRCRAPSFVIAIENKIGAGEGRGQLARYEKAVREAFPGEKALFVFLTPDGDEASEEAWVSYSYESLYATLERLRTTGAGSIGDEVSTFLNHYTRLLRSRVMDDETIAELCQRIYKNHRQAIDLIVEHAATGESEALRIVRELIDQQADRWHVFEQTGTAVRFVPRSWLGLLPEINSRPRSDPRAWMHLTAGVNNGQFRLMVVCHRATDPLLRQTIVDHLLSHGQAYGFKRTRSGLARGWNSLGQLGLVRLESEDEGDLDRLRRQVESRLEKLWEQWKGSDRLLAEAVKGSGDG